MEIRFSSLIRADREYQSVLLTLREQVAAAKTLPIAVNGLSGGASTAFLTECVRDAREATAAPVLLLAASEEERERLCALLSRGGLNALSYPGREPVFHSISASHDSERERLSVLSALLNGKVDAVVTTAAAALFVTLPPARLADCSLSLSVGDEMPMDALCGKLVSLGFAAVDMVENAGQFAHRGGIVDLYVSAD